MSFKKALATIGISTMAVSVAPVTAFAYEGEDVNQNQNVNSVEENNNVEEVSTPDSTPVENTGNENNMALFQTAPDPENHEVVSDPAPVISPEEQRVLDAEADYAAAQAAYEQEAARLDPESEEFKALEAQRKAAETALNIAIADRTAAEAEVHKAEADVSMAQDAVDQATQDVSDKEAAANTAVATAEQLMNNATQAEENLNTIKQEVATAQTAVDTAQTAVDAAQAAYDATLDPTSPEVQAVQQNLQTAQENVASAETAEATAQANVDQAQTDLAHAQAAQSAAEEIAQTTDNALNSANQDLADKTNAYNTEVARGEELAAAVTDAGTAKTAAETTVNTATADATNAEAARANADQAYKLAEEALKTAENNVLSAEGRAAELEAIKAEAEAQGSVGFFRWRLAQDDCTEDEKIALNYAIALLTDKDVQLPDSWMAEQYHATTWDEYTSYTSVGSENDATSLENMKRTFEYMREVNRVRAIEAEHPAYDWNASGDPDSSVVYETAKVNDVMMAMAQLDCNYFADGRRGQMPNANWFAADEQQGTAEATKDVDYTAFSDEELLGWTTEDYDQIGSVPTAEYIAQQVAYMASLSPEEFDEQAARELYFRMYFRDRQDMIEHRDWFKTERALREYYQFYLQTTDPGHDRMGYAVRQNAGYGNVTTSQMMDSSLINNYGPAYSVDEYEAKFMEYYNSTMNGAEQAEKDLAAAKAALEDAKAVRDQKLAELTAAEQKKAEADEALRVAQDNLTAAENRLNAAVGQSEAHNGAIVDALNNVTAARTAVENAQAAANAAKADVETKKAATATAGAALETAQSDLADKKEAVTDAKTKLASAESAARALSEEAYDALVEKKADLEATKQVLTEKKNAETGAQAQYDTLLTLLDEATDSIDATAKALQDAMNAKTEKETALRDAAVKYQETIDLLNQLKEIEAVKAADLGSANGAIEEVRQSIRDAEETMKQAKRALDNAIWRLNHKDDPAPVNFGSYVYVAPANSIDPVSTVYTLPSVDYMTILSVTDEIKMDNDEAVEQMLNVKFPLLTYRRITNKKVLEEIAKYLKLCGIDGELVAIYGINEADEASQADMLKYAAGMKGCIITPEGTFTLDKMSAYMQELIRGMVIIVR